MNEEPIRSSVIAKLEGIMNLFLRILALIFIGFAIKYWLVVVGVLDPEIRFDTMSNHWKVASTFLSVFYPIAALGLWGLYRWGIVIWFLTASVELVMHLLYPQLYGQFEALVIFHLASMFIWLVYSVAEYWDQRRTLIQNSR